MDNLLPSAESFLSSVPDGKKVEGSSLTVDSIENGFEASSKSERFRNFVRKVSKRSKVSPPVPSVASEAPLALATVITTLPPPPVSTTEPKIDGTYSGTSSGTNLLAKCLREQPSSPSLAGNLPVELATGPIIRLVRGIRRTQSFPGVESSEVKALGSLMSLDILDVSSDPNSGVERRKRANSANQITAMKFPKTTTQGSACSLTESFSTSPGLDSISTPSESNISTTSSSSSAPRPSDEVKNIKRVHFLPGFDISECIKARLPEDLENKNSGNGRGSKCPHNSEPPQEFPPGSPQLDQLIEDLSQPDFANPIEHYDFEALASAVSTLPPPVDKEIMNLRTKLVDITAAKKRNTKPVPSKPELYFLFKRLLRFLDTRTSRSFLCRDCECFHCERHLSSSKSGPVYSYYPVCALTYIIGADMRYGRIFGTPFRFGQLQYLMKLFTRDLNYSQHARIFNAPSVHPDIRNDYVVTHEFYPVNDHLLSRMQHWYHLTPGIKDPWEMAELAVLVREKRIYRGFTQLCKHVHDKAKKVKDFQIWDFENEANNPRVKRCDDCALEYRYDWYDVGDLGKGLVLSIWRDFGWCLTPFDPRFMVHFEEFNDIDYKERFKKDLSTGWWSKNDKRRWKEDMESAASCWPVGDIQKVFEAESGFNLADCLEWMSISKYAFKYMAHGRKMIEEKKANEEWHPLRSGHGQSCEGKGKAIESENDSQRRPLVVCSSMSTFAKGKAIDRGNDSQGGPCVVFSSTSTIARGKASLN